ncbi:conserved hypothetical protein [Culex quinquefasciatus]|uniref:Uncharacterized protein n=1 Tax=Culex quinquefasciatus TaxID=7176 RepID=B0XKY8_CULQU|nr:conserved hypothetical protein [Culex quinquefasciatus]|eukprot:XP_001870310.1 conserved hypothetical protein [Culex quinquefasciatus]
MEGVVPPLRHEISKNGPRILAPAGRLVRCFDRANWSTFARSIEREVDLNASWINDLDRSEKIDDAIDKFTAILKAAEESAVPSRRILPQKKEIPDELKLLIRLRNWCQRAEFIRRRDPLIGAVVTHLNNVISTKSAEHRHKNFGSLLRTLDNGSNKFWKLTRNLRNTVNSGNLRGLLPLPISGDDLEIIRLGENQYDLSLLEIIERPELEALMPHPYMADRSKCIQGLNRWRLGKGLPPITAPLSNIDQNVPTTSCNRGDYTAKSLIQDSDKGRGIVRTYNDTQLLSKDAKTAITQIVVDEFVDKFGKLTTPELKQRSDELAELFPKEPKVELKEIKAWLRHEHDDWEEVKLKWAQTTTYRLNEAYCGRFTLEDLITEYPLLSNPKGHTLVEADFRYKYPGVGDALFKSWGRFRTSIYDFFEADIADAGGKVLVKLLTDGKSSDGVALSDDARDCITIILLVYLLPTLSVTLNQEGKKRWKPSFAESKEAFLVHVTSQAEIETGVDRYRNRCKLNGWPAQPLMIVVGSKLTEITDYLVYLGGSCYRFSTFLKSLEVCYKLFKIYKLSFPAESSGPWALIGHSLFNFEVTERDVHYRQICRIQTHLNNHD